jgi:hypothetical protein
MRSFVVRHPVASYLISAYAIFWACWMPVLLLGAPPRLLSALGAIAGLALPAFLVTAATDGRAGVRDLLRRTVRWRVGVGWYLLAMLAIPLGALLLAPLVLDQAPLQGLLRSWPQIVPRQSPTQDPPRPEPVHDHRAGLSGSAFEPTRCPAKIDAERARHSEPDAHQWPFPAAPAFLVRGSQLADGTDEGRYDDACYEPVTDALEPADYGLEVLALKVYDDPLGIEQVEQPAQFVRQVNRQGGGILTGGQQLLDQSLR